MLRECSRCGRLHCVNADGSTRKHRCAVLPRKLPRHYQGRKCVPLRTGGQLEIAGSFDWMRFGEPERALMVAIFDAIAAYQLIAVDGGPVEQPGTAEPSKP